MVQKEEIMETKDLNLRTLYKKLLIGLLSIDDFSLDYFSLNRNLREIIFEFLNGSSVKSKKDKQLLLIAVETTNLENISDEDFSKMINYENGECIEYIFYNHHSYFSDFSLDEKLGLIAIDLCFNSILKFIFDAKKIPFYFDDFCYLLTFVFPEGNVYPRFLIEKAIEKGFAELDEIRQRMSWTNNFTYELLRLSHIPEFKVRDTGDFELTENENFSSIGENCFLAFTGSDAASYIYAKLQEEEIRFWYAADMKEALELLECFEADKILNEKLWINNYQPGNLLQESELLQKVNETNTKLIVSGTQLEDPFGVTCVNVFLKNRNSKETNLENKTRVKMVEESDFFKRYGRDGMLLSENQGMFTKIMDIYRRLMEPAYYLTVEKNMLKKINEIINQHPNLVDKDVLLAFIKDAFLFAKNSEIKIPPLLLVGNPGCGKSLLCTQLREVLNQDNDIFIPLGSGLGVAGMMGSTPEYKSAEHGKILSAIWLANRNSNCANPLVVLDELDKNGYLSTDANQNVYATLIQLLGDINISQFQDNYFQVPIRNFHLNVIATANNLESIPEALLDRLNIIKFRDYTQDELKSIVIPLQYKFYKDSHNDLIPETLSSKEVDIIYKLSNGKPRQIRPSIIKYLSVLFDDEGQRQQLDSNKIDRLMEMSVSNNSERQIGFWK